MSSQPPVKPESSSTQRSAKVEAAQHRAHTENQRQKRDELKQQIQDTLPPHLAALAFEDLNATRKSDNIWSGVAMLIFACALALFGAFLVSQATNKKSPAITIDGIAMPKKTKSKKSKIIESPVFTVALDPVHDPNFNKKTTEEIKQLGLKRLFDSLDYTKPASVASSIELLTDDEAINVLQQLPSWRLPAVYERINPTKLAGILKVMLSTPEWKSLLYNIPAEALKQARAVGTTNGLLGSQQQTTINQAIASGQLPTDKGLPPGYRSPTNPQSLPDNTATPSNVETDQRYSTSGTTGSTTATATDRYAPATDRYATP